MNRVTARDTIAEVINDAWSADASTTGLALLWDDVTGEKPGEDADGNALPYGRCSIRHLTAEQETLGGPGVRKHQIEGIVTVQIFTPYGDGQGLADLIAQVLIDATRNVRVGELWFLEAQAREVGQSGPWSQTNFQASFRYTETA
jgi:hypothetical protein